MNEFDTSSIELVRAAYRAYLLEKNTALFQAAMTDEKAHLILYESRWIGACDIIHEEYETVPQSDNTCMVYGKVDFCNKHHDILTERNTRISVLCVKDGDNIKFASVHNSGNRKQVITNQGYIDKDVYYRSVMEHLCDVLMEIDIEKNEMYFDKKKYEEFFNEPPTFDNVDQWFWHVCTNFVNKNDAEKMDIFRETDITKRLKNNDFIFDTQFRMNRGQDKDVWVHMRIVFVPDSEMVAVSKVYVLLDDITYEMMEKMQNLEFARTDSLTRLWNRRYTEEQIVNRISEYGKGIFMIVDVDRFKDVNDTYGHITGDNLLKRVSANMLAKLNEGDVLGRFGGDEFILYLARTEDEEADVRHINEIVGAAKFQYTEESVDMNIHCSAGAVFFEGGDVTFEMLYEAADKIMYDAKAAGRDMVNIQHMS